MVGVSSAPIVCAASGKPCRQYLVPVVGGVEDIMSKFRYLFCCDESMSTNLRLLLTLLFLTQIGMD